MRSPAGKESRAGGLHPLYAIATLLRAKPLERWVGRRKFGAEAFLPITLVRRLNALGRMSFRVFDLDKTALNLYKLDLNEPICELHADSQVSAFGWGISADLA